MLRFIALGALLSILLGCSAQQGAGSGEFYTWVDERGQLQTMRRENRAEERASKQKSDSAGAALPETAEASPASPVQPSSKANTIDPEDYTPSEQVDEKIKQTRLYAWQDESGQQIQEQEKLDPIEKEDMGLEIESPIIMSQRSILPEACCLIFASMDRFKWEDIADKELTLEDLYSHVNEFERDVLVVELPDSDISSIRVISFIRKNKIALPDLIVLDNRFNVIQSISAPYSHYVEESWTSYGFLQGQIDESLLKGGRYLVLTPSSQLGILELDKERIKISDFGTIMVRLDAPAL